MFEGSNKHVSRMFFTKLDQRLIKIRKIESEISSTPGGKRKDRSFIFLETFYDEYFQRGNGESSGLLKIRHLPHGHFDVGKTKLKIQIGSDHSRMSLSGSRSRKSNLTTI